MGEPSGDRLAGGVLKAMRALLPQGQALEVYGLGGPALAAEGCKLLADPTGHAAVGLVEQLPGLAPTLKAVRALKAQLKRQPPDLLYLVDFQGVNLPLAAWAKRRGLKVAYDTPPQDWIWSLHPKGCGRLRGRVDLVLARLAPEATAYGVAGLPVAFVGHPVADLGQPPPRPAVAPAEAKVLLLPGSRQAEVARLAGPMAEAAALLSQSRPFLRVSAIAARPELEAPIRAAMAGPLAHLGDRFRVQVGGLPEALKASEAGLVASGTAVLEAAMLGLPCALAYRVHPITALVATWALRRRTRQGLAGVRLPVVGEAGQAFPFVGLPNLLLGEARLPELLQGACTPEGLALALSRALDEPTARHAAASLPEALAASVGPPGSALRAAAASLRLLGLAASPPPLATYNLPARP